MQVFHSLSQLTELSLRSSVAIGNFDGVHQGHVALLRDMTATARANGWAATVLTFYPHPVEVLRPGTRLERLSTTNEKLKLLEALGVDLVLVETFSSELAQLSPQEFFQRYLHSGLNAASIHVGFNFRFGKDRAGDVSTLEAMAKPFGIQLRVQAPFELDGVRVSSSLLRQLVHHGDINKLNFYLGRPYLISGQVAPGDQRGRDLGFPTANLRYSHEKALPQNGVYVTRALWQKQVFPAVTNIGIRPTFEVEAPLKPVIETHFIDFKAKLYDEFVQLEFLEKIREEKKFSSKQELISQIEKDVDYSRQYFSNAHPLGK